MNTNLITPNLVGTKQWKGFRMRFLGANLVTIGAVVTSTLLGNDWPATAGIVASLMGFMMFIEDVIENPRKR